MLLIIVSQQRLETVMSNHFKTIIFCSIALLLLFAWHFATVFGILGSPPQTRSEFFVRFGLFMAAFFISCVGSLIYIAIKEDTAEPDEREQLIELRVERNSILVLYAGMVCLMWFVFKPMQPMQVANAILGIICVAETFKIVTALKYLRKGM